MIYIFSEYDDQTMDRIIKWLNFYNTDYIRFTNKTVSAIKNIYINKPEKDNYIEIQTEKGIFRFDKDSIIFIRRGYLIFKNLINNANEKIIREWLHGEINSLYNYINYFIENKTRFCIGSLINVNINKLQQLYAAIDVGFDVPETIITSEFHSVYSKTENIKYITKPISNIMIDKDDNYNYTSGGVKNISIEKINSTKIKFPSLIQNKIEKSIEIRVFFFLDNYYALGLINYNSQKNKKTDWRDYIGKVGRLRYFPLILPNEILKKLKLLSKKFNINTGSYDLLFDGEKYYYLEVNTHGQFGFVSLIGNYHIERDIAKTLNLADKNN